MEIAYRLNNREIEKLKKYKDPSILLKKNNILKNGKYKLHLTIGMFNKLLEKGELKYTFTDKRKNYYLQQGGSLGDIFKAILPYAKDFAKKIIPALGVATTSTLVSHGINKELNKKKKTGGNIKIDSNRSTTDIKKINNIVEKLSNMKLTNYKSINQQTGRGIFTSLLIPIIDSMIPSSISGKGFNDIFFEELNNLDYYPMSILKIDEILKDNESYIGTFSKDNVPILKNNQSAIVDLDDSLGKGMHWISYRKIGNKIFYFDNYGVAYIPDIIKNQYPNHKFICNIYRIQSIDSVLCGRFCILFVKSNIKMKMIITIFYCNLKKMIF